MNSYTLREVCEIVGVSRRAIQGYEKAGLVKPSGKNNRGYLLYNEEKVQRISTIRMFQQFGFTVKEIGVIIDGEKEDIKKALEGKLIQLEEDTAAQQEIIQKIKKLIENLTTQTGGK